MSETQYLYLNGTAEFARTNKSDDYGNYSVRIALDDESLEEYKKSGIQVAIEEGNMVWLRRPHSKIINKELVYLGPPRVVNDETGEDWNVLIGKGSQITVKVRAYPTQKGKGHTLDAIGIRKLVPVEGGNGFKPY